MITKAGNRESNRNLFPRVLSLLHLRKEELEEGRDFRMEVAGTGRCGIHPQHRMKGKFSSTRTKERKQLSEVLVFCFVLPLI